MKKNVEVFGGKKTPIGGTLRMKLPNGRWGGDKRRGGGVRGRRHVQFDQNSSCSCCNRDGTPSLWRVRRRLGRLFRFPFLWQPCDPPTHPRPLLPLRRLLWGSSEGVTVFPGLPLPLRTFLSPQRGVEGGSDDERTVPACFVEARAARPFLRPRSER